MIAESIKCLTRCLSFKEILGNTRNTSVSLQAQVTLKPRREKQNEIIPFWLPEIPLLLSEFKENSRPRKGLDV